MSVELYSENIIVVAGAERLSYHKIWLRTEAPADLTGDLRWLCEEYLDYHIIVDLSHLENLGAASYKVMLDLQRMAEEYDYRFVLCGLSEHLKRQLGFMHLTDEFDTFDTREAALTELSALCEETEE